MRFIKENINSNYDLVIEKIINERKQEIFDFFNTDNIDLDFNIYIYDSIESLARNMRLRGYNDPDYMCACFKDEDNSLNFFEPKDNPNQAEWSKDEYKQVIFHELIHGIQFNLFGTTPEWINEGIAKVLDGEYSKGIKYLMENYINIREIPEQREIEEEFGCHDYDSYIYAFIMVSYIIEMYGKNYLIELLKDSNKLNMEKVGLLNRAINYYNRKYFNLFDEYLNQDINNPKYLFHGSPKRLTHLEPRLSHDSDNNKNNIAEAVFLFPSFLKSTPYAFKDTIKEDSNKLGMHYSFMITNDDEYPLMTMKNVIINPNIVGYIYVFIKDDDMIKDKRSYQYKCYKELIPIDIIEVHYKEYEKYYEVFDEKNKDMCKNTK